MSKRIFSVRRKLLIGLACGLVTVSAALTIMQYRISTRLLTEEWEAKSVEFARLLKVAIQPLLEHGDHPGLRQAVTETVSVPGIKTLTVVNTQGLIVADSHERDVGEPLKLHLNAVRSALEEAKADLSWVESTPNGRVRYILTPMKGPSIQSPRPNPVLGALMVGIDLSVMDELVESNLRYLLFVNGISFVALMAIFWTAIRVGLVQPLTALTETMRATPGAMPLAGQISTRSDEIGMLTETFARMTEALDRSEALNRAILSSVKTQTAVLDQQGLLLMLNSAWEEFSKANDGAFPAMGGGLVNFLDTCRAGRNGYGDKALEAVAGIDAVLKGVRQEFALEFRCPFGSGSQWFLLSAVPLLREGGGAVITHVDITERKLAEDIGRKAKTDAERAHSSLTALYTALPLGLMYLSADLRLIRASQTLLDMSGRPMDELVGQPLSLIMPVDRWGRLQPILDQVLQTGKPFYGLEEVYPDTRAPGGLRYVLSDFYPDRAGEGTTIGIHAIVQDVTAQRHTEKEHERRLEELEAKNRELDQMAIRDPLTGLYNRRFFDEALAREWQQFQRSGEAFTVIIMDVDAFKAINDHHGHEIGDRALLQVAATLRGTLRESDLIARVGGDEFAALLPRTDTERSGPVAEKLRDVLRRLRVTTAGGSIPMSLSLGVATVPGFPPVTSAAELLRVADKRMYDAKRLASTGRADAG